MLKKIFFALILDILSFTIILPLFPRLIKFYDSQHALFGSDPVYASFLETISQFRRFVNPNSASKLDIVLIGGIVGSLFSFLQFLASPVIGRLSDSYGRKSVLMLTMVGNVLSALLWIVSDNFLLFLLSRIVGGLSEGNVQISISMITDLTDEKTRSKGLALVGIAFALGFTFGPAIGASMTLFDVVSFVPPEVAKLYHLNPFSTAGLLSASLLIIETLYIWFFFTETKLSKPASLSNTKNSKLASSQNNNHVQRTALLCNFFFLFLFSGMEFTLTFLMFDRFGFTNMQQGKLLGCIGILSSLIQGGYVRRMSFKIGELSIAKQGLLAACMSATLLAIVGSSLDPFLVVGGDGTRDSFWTLSFVVLTFAFTSGTVVNGLTALYSMHIPKEMQERRGEIMGYFRSSGQLGRSLGPISICSLYWMGGSVQCYSVVGAGLFCVFLMLASVKADPTAVKVKKS